MLGCILHLAAMVTKIWVITDDEWWILSSQVSKATFCPNTPHSESAPV